MNNWKEIIKIEMNQSENQSQFKNKVILWNKVCFLFLFDLLNLFFKEKSKEFGINEMIVEIENVSRILCDGWSVFLTQSMTLYLKMVKNHSRMKKEKDQFLMRGWECLKE